MITIKVDTIELYKNYLQTVGMAMFDSTDLFGSGMSDTFLENLRNIAYEEMEDIRRLFSSGETVMLIPNRMTELDFREGDPRNDIEKEIRVYSRDGKLLGVVIDSEINY
jgi:hypothetical protein